MVVDVVDVRRSRSVVVVARNGMISWNSTDPSFPDIHLSPSRFPFMEDQDCAISHVSART